MIGLLCVGDLRLHGRTAWSRRLCTPWPRGGRLGIGRRSADVRRWPWSTWAMRSTQAKCGARAAPAPQRRPLGCQQGRAGKIRDLYEILKNRPHLTKKIKLMKNYNVYVNNILHSNWVYSKSFVLNFQLYNGYLNTIIRILVWRGTIFTV